MATSQEVDYSFIRPVIYMVPPGHMRYPVDQADQRLPYVNYLPIIKERYPWSEKGPVTQVYSPQNGTPESAIRECLIRAEGDFRRSGGMGVPMVRRQEACLNPLRWSERKARNSENFF